MARTIAQRLEQLYPGRSAFIQDRLQMLLADYQAAAQEARAVLAPVKSAGFVVQHRGYDHFVEAFGLNQLGWISLSPEQPPGARHLYQLEQQLKEPAGEGARCLFVERSHRSATASNLAARLGLRLQPLDILGESAADYPALIQALAADVANCLAPGP